MFLAMGMMDGSGGNVEKSGEPGKASKPALAAVAVVHVAVTVLTWRDLRSRTTGQVRGSKRIWRTASALNTLGSVAYWLLGRRRRGQNDASLG